MPILGKSMDWAGGNISSAKRLASRLPRCCVCNEYNSRRRFRDRGGIMRMVCSGCVQEWFVRQRKEQSR